jgi:hypothetical protein
MKLRVDIAVSLQMHQCTRICRPVRRENMVEIRVEESELIMKGTTNWIALSDRIMKFLMKCPDGLKPDYTRFFIVARLTYPIGVIGHAGFFLIFWYLDLEILAAFNIFSVALFVFAVLQHK